MKEATSRASTSKFGWIYKALFAKRLDHTAWNLANIRGILLSYFWNCRTQCFFTNPTVKIIFYWLTQRPTRSSSSTSNIQRVTWCAAFVLLYGLTKNLRCCSSKDLVKNCSQTIQEMLAVKSCWKAVLRTLFESFLENIFSARISGGGNNVSVKIVIVT